MATAGEGDVSQEASDHLLVDLDGFFKPLVEMGEVSPAVVLASLPLNDGEAARAFTLHQLFRSALLLTADGAQPGDGQVLSQWSVLSLAFAVLSAQKDSPFSLPLWKTFYSADLHQHMRENHPETEDTSLELTLDRRLVAWTDVPNKIIRVSALTRDYLLRINILLANFSELVVEEGRPLSRDDAHRFFEFAFAYVVRLHRTLNPGALPIARPRNAGSLSFAQHITQIQIGFLMSHEFAHVILGDDGKVSRADLEHQCDSFAFEKLCEFNVPNWMRFLGIRWLFELLAFDRVLGECLNFSEGDWTVDIDWVQEELRERMRLQEQLSESEGGVLTAYENVGSLFLLDLKYELRRLGSDSLRLKVSQLERTQSLPSGTALTARVREVLGQMPAETPISVERMLG